MEMRKSAATSINVIHFIDLQVENPQKVERTMQISPANLTLPGHLWSSWWPTRHAFRATRTPSHLGPIPPREEENGGEQPSCSSLSYALRIIPAHGGKWNEQAWCLANSLRVPQAFLRQSVANATKHSDYVRKHLRQNAQKGHGNRMNLRDACGAAGIQPWMSQKANPSIKIIALEKPKCPQRPPGGHRSASRCF